MTIYYREVIPNPAMPSPKSLEKLCSRAIAKNLMANVEGIISKRSIISNNKDITQMFQHKVVPKINLWWNSLSWLCSSLKRNLQEDIDDLTEEDSALHKECPIRNLSVLFIKLLTLNEVFYDREYYMPISGAHDDCSSEESEDFDENGHDSDMDFEDESNDGTFDDFLNESNDYVVAEHDNDYDAGNDYESEVHYESDDHSENESDEENECNKDTATDNVNNAIMEEETESPTCRHEEYFCLLPSYLENTVVSALNTFGPFALLKLTLYGCLASKITVALLEKCHNLEILSISFGNMNDKVMASIGNHCSKLRQLEFTVCGLSMEAIVKGFFKNLITTQVRKMYEIGQSIPLSFPNLIFLDFNDNHQEECSFSELKKWIQFYYKRISCFNLSCMLTRNVNYGTLTEKSMNNLTVLVVSFSFFFQVYCSNLNQMMKSYAKLKNLRIRCWPDMYTEQDMIVAGNNLKHLHTEYKLKNELVICHTSNRHTQYFLNPTFAILGNNIFSITIILKKHIPKDFLLSTLQKVLLCPSLVQLKLCFMSLYDINYDAMNCTDFKFNRNKLRELWFHETDPWLNSNETFRKTTEVHLWFKLLDLLQISSPELEILSITVWDMVPIIFDKVTSNVSTFHLLHECYRDEIISCHDLVKMVKQFPNLKNLFLERLHWESFWNLKNYFINTDLRIFWGNLDGRPRSYGPF